MIADLQTMPKPVETVQTNVHVGVVNESVVLAFDERISWLEITPVIAIQIAELMKEKAIEILRSEPKP